MQAAIPMDPNQMQSPATPTPPPAPSSSRKRKKTDAMNGDDAPHPAEPRRLRRSHEACARCRSKKIKCNQEDRHRQTLIARGHTELIERQLTGCVALLKRHIPNFELVNLDDALAREGIDILPFSPIQRGTPYPDPGSPTRGFPLRSEGGAAPPFPPPDPSRPYPGMPPVMGPPPPGYAGPIPIHQGYPYPPPHMTPLPPPPGYNPHIHPAFQNPLPPPPPPSNHDGHGPDPLPHDLSSAPALAKNFGVSDAIISHLTLAPAAIDTEDFAVGSNGLTSRRDRDISDQPLPKDAAKWLHVAVRRGSVTSPTSPPLLNATTGSPAASNSISIWLPKDRKMVQHILDVYFSRLNFHRPVFTRVSFEQKLWALYDGQVVQHDPGYVCSVYLVLALATLSELNHRVNGLEKEGNATIKTTLKANVSKVMPPDWPSHEEFFDRALAVKPDLRVTVSSLQALILLHWYLYTERQGRTLWRLVGSLVRLAIELGLHHDPTTPSKSSMQDPNDITSPPPTYSEEECQLRIRLWAIVLIHDRGTSILLGRPLGIAPFDSNTPRPSRPLPGEISEHFVLSGPVAEIQADIINSLYTPSPQNADSIMRHATRIIKSMVVFRKQLPESYRWYFSGTEDWSAERRSKLVQEMTEEQGLTLLKIGITRILLLRALFSSQDMPYNSRYRALVDAIVCSHNIIVIHNQLLRFPDIAFYVSPIPLHIAAMVILFGHMSKCDRLPREVAMEDVWMALDMLPSFRWRWERKDLAGSHPLISKLAEEVLKVNLHQVAPTSPPMLLSEQDWDSELSPKSLSAIPPPMTPKMGPSQYAPLFGSLGPRPMKGSPGKNGKTDPSSPASSDEQRLPHVPPALFYPFFPNETSNAATAMAAAMGAGSAQEFHRLLAAAGSQVMSNAGYQPSQESYMLEEKDGSLLPASGMQMWMSEPLEDTKPMHSFPMPSSSST